MSLISGANFAAPLRSKVQIVAIFALAVLVAVLRMAQSSTGSDGDGARLGSDSAQGVTARDSFTGDDVDSYLASRRKSKAREVDSAVDGDPTVDKLFQGGGLDSGSRRAAKQEADDRASEPEKLNDIKRSLGME